MQDLAFCTASGRGDYSACIPAVGIFLGYSDFYGTKLAGIGGGEAILALLLRLPQGSGIGAIFPAFHTFEITQTHMIFFGESVGVHSGHISHEVNVPSIGVSKSSAKCYDTFRNGDGEQALAGCESVSSYSRQVWGKGDFAELGASHECGLVDGCDLIREVKFSQTRTIVKCTLSDVADAVGYGNFGQAGAIVKGIVTNVGESVGKEDLA